MQPLELVPMTRDDALAFVAQHHRHHKHRPAGHCFAIGLARDEQIVGVAMVGRPEARRLQDGWTAEVTRLAVANGERHACSKLYAACWRAARAIGYRRLVTYTLPSEGGGFPPRRRLEADRHDARWFVEQALAAARGQGADAREAPMGAGGVIGAAILSRHTRAVLAPPNRRAAFRFRRTSTPAAPPPAGQRPVRDRQRWFFRTGCARLVDRRRSNLRRRGPVVGRRGRHA